MRTSEGSYALVASAFVLGMAAGSQLPWPTVAVTAVASSVALGLYTFYRVTHARQPTGDREPEAEDGEGQEHALRGLLPVRIDVRTDDDGHRGASPHGLQHTPWT